jgi:hypothetical protein
MANNIPKFKVTQADFDLLNEIFAFKDAEPLSEQLVSKLIRKGWPSSIFLEIQSSDFVPRCEHGGAIVYYSKKRNSLLLSIQDELPTTLEIEQNLTKHFHSLPHKLPNFSPF